MLTTNSLSNEAARRCEVGLANRSLVDGNLNVINHKRNTSSTLAAGDGNLSFVERTDTTTERDTTLIHLDREASETCPASFSQLRGDYLAKIRICGGKGRRANHWRIFLQ